MGEGAKYIINKEGGLANIKNKSKPNFNNVADTKEGMFKDIDDYGESYYYRGIADNWVDFGNFYWRIVRINGDGTIKLIYSGTKSSHSGSDTAIAMSPYNTNNEAEKYADYKIRNIKNTVENWYKNNILGKPFESKIADSGFCSDMSKIDEKEFGSFNRVKNSKPSFMCPNRTADLLSRENGKLTYPVGLITMDEVAFAGGVLYKPNNNYYLNTGKFYSTMSPAEWGGASVRTGAVVTDGSLYLWRVASDVGVRPVINLKRDVVIESGNGTEISPYIVS